MSCRRQILLAVTVAVLASSLGCGPAITLRVLEPAAVTVPPHVETLAVIDRSRPSDAGEGVLGVLEGVVTGEAIGVDTEGRHAAIEGMGAGLANSPRFRVVRTITSRQEVRSSLFDSDLPWDAAAALCADLGCSGIVALEAFDSDSRVDHEIVLEEYTDDEGEKRRRQVHKVRRITHVLAAWRTYDLVGRRVVDDLRDHMTERTWRGEGKTEHDARDELPSQYQTVRMLAVESGEAYAARIAPTWALVRRPYFATGHDVLREAKPYVLADDWLGAEQLWHEVRDYGDTKTRAKAAFNLALACEVDGRLERAVEWASDAVIGLPNAKVRRYLALLKRRLAEQELLREQMSGAPGGR
jgi:hypothetical protein